MSSIEKGLSKKQNRENKVDRTLDNTVEIKKIFENQIERKWLTSKEVSHYLAISENALRIMVYRNQIVSYKFGHRLRFLLTDCESLLRKQGATHGN